VIDVVAVIVHLLYIHHTIWLYLLWPSTACDAITLSKEIANSNKHQATAVWEESSFLLTGRMAREIV